MLNGPRNWKRRAAASQTGGGRRLAAAGIALLGLAVGLPFAVMGLDVARYDAPSEPASAPVPPQAPRRIVSLNPCLDAILLHVAEPGQIAALSHYSRDPASSTVADLARRFPFTYATAEEVLMQKPDLVLASVHTAPATRRALERMSIPVSAFGVPNTVEESLRQIRDIAALVGHPERGEELARRINAALASIRATGKPIPALILQPDGFSPGTGTLQDDLLSRAGLANQAPRYGVDFWGIVPLERLVANPPRLLLTGDPHAGTPAARDRLLGHPVLRRLEGRMALAYYPPQLLYCGGPSLIEAARSLSAARKAVESAS